MSGPFNGYDINRAGSSPSSSAADAGFRTESLKKRSTWRPNFTGKTEPHDTDSAGLGPIAGRVGPQRPCRSPRPAQSAPMISTISEICIGVR